MSNWFDSSLIPVAHTLINSNDFGQEGRITMNLFFFSSHGSKGRNGTNLPVIRLICAPLAKIRCHGFQLKFCRSLKVNFRCIFF